MGKGEKTIFENMNPMRAVLKMALPSVAAQVILVLYNMADLFFLGLLGSDEKLVAVTVCTPAFMFLSALGNLFGTGGGSVLSKALGQKRREDAENAASFAVLGGAVCTLFYLLLVFLFRNPFIDLLGGRNSGFHKDAVQYLLFAVILGGPGAMGSVLLAHLLRAEGHSMKAGIGLALGGVLNVILDPVFMFLLFPAGMEVTGAAAATALSNTVALVYLAITEKRYRKTGSVIKLRPLRGTVARENAKKVVFAGFPSFIMTLMENVSFAVLDGILAPLGADPLAGLGVAKKINMLAHCTVRGIAQGTLPLVAYSYGKKNIERLRKIIRSAAILSVSCALCCTLFAQLAPGLPVRVFVRPEMESYRHAVTYLRILSIGGPFSAFAYLTVSVYQATGRPKTAVIVALLRKGLLDIPGMFLLVAFGLQYFAPAATPAADIICCVTAIIIFTRFIRETSNIFRKDVKSND